MLPLSRAGHIEHANLKTIEPVKNIIRIFRAIYPGSFATLELIDIKGLIHFLTKLDGQGGAASRFITVPNIKDLRKRKSFLFFIQLICSQLFPWDFFRL